MKYRLVPTIDLLIIDRSRAVLDIVDARETDFAIVPREFHRLDVAWRRFMRGSRIYFYAYLIR